MTGNKPRVSIGLPVFNGEKYLAETLDSILSQTYRDFDLIISDNASTDHTEQICLRYLAKDSRIHYYRNKKNIGVSANFNRVFQLSSSQYFKWAAYDDIHAPNFLEKCVGVLDNDSSIVLCHSKTGRIDDCGRHIGEYKFKLRVDSSKPHERFGDLIRMDNEAWIYMFGLMRSEALRKTQLLGSYVGADRNLLSEIALVGRYYEIPEYLFFRREHQKAYTETPNFKYSDKLKWWANIDTKGKAIFPYWRICFEYFNSVDKMPVGRFERERCYAQVFKWLASQGWVWLTYDVGINIMSRSSLRRTMMPLAEWLMHRGGVDLLGSSDKNGKIISHQPLAKSLQPSGLPAKLGELNPSRNGFGINISVCNGLEIEKTETKPTKVSVLITIKNVANYISPCLSSILAQSYKDFEIVIVDDLSDDGTKEKILAFHDDRIRYFVNKEFLGRTESRNKSVQLARGRYLYFTDGDCEVHENWIQEGMKFFEGSDIAGVEGRTIYVSEEYKPTRSDAVVQNCCGGDYMTCNIAYERSALEKAGGFDGRFTHLEDRDIALRAIKNGRIVFDSKMIVCHQKKSMNPRQFMKTADVLSNRVFLYKKFGDLPRPLFFWRIYMPLSLAELIYPPMVFGSFLSKNKYKSKADLAIFPYIYLNLFVERLLFWKTCAKEKVALL